MRTTRQRRSVHVSMTDGRSGRAMASRQPGEFRHDGLRTCYLNRPSALSAPTLFVHGTDDPLLPASWSERAAGRMGGDLGPFEGCGHWPACERPERFDRTVRQFLGGYRLRPARLPRQFRSVSTATNVG